MKRLQLIPLSAVCGFPLSCALAQPCGSPWSLSTGAAPASRSNVALSYDSDRGKVVLFGGLSGTALVGDTWEWAAAGPGGGGAWTQRATAGPAARSQMGLAYDSARHRTVLFGGEAGNTYFSDTWEWDGITWTSIATPSTPPAMWGFLMVYDASRQRTVLIRPYGGSPNYTWEYNGVTWTPVSDSPPIPNGTGVSLAYDAARSVVVYTGPAYVPSLTSAVTYERTGAGWVLRNSDQIPTPNQFYTGTRSTTYDPVRQQVLFMDITGTTGATGIWGWDGAAGKWQAVSTGGPGAAYGRAVAYDAAGDQLVMFGSSQTWLFRSDVRDGPTVTEIGPRAQGFSLGGSPFTLSVQGIGSAPVTYRWRLNSVELSDGGVFSGTGTTQLTVDPTDVVYTGYYDCLVTDSCGTTYRPYTRVEIGCYANCDGSSTPPRLNAEDFQCFLNTYAAGMSYANCDGSTAPPVLNANDFQCFLNKYSQGCP